MGNIVPFSFEGHGVRTIVDESGQRWFVARDIATILGYTNPQKAVRDHCKGARDIGSSSALEGERFVPLPLAPQTIIIPERDVYRLVMRSRLPAAERFEDWVVGEVLGRRPLFTPGNDHHIVKGEQRAMGNIIPFSFEGHGVRTIVDESGQPWFNASDVCDALEMGNPSQAIKSHVDAEDLQKLETLTAGGRQRQNHVNESGLYALILGSTKPSAKRFKRWVTSEVLPSIRKTGSYGADNVQYLNDPAWLRGALVTYTERVERLERQANDNAPKLQAYDLIATSSDGSLSVTEVAKLLQQRPRDLFTWLAVNKWLYRRAGGRSWLAYQSRIQSGFMEHKITEVTQPDGLPRFIEQARITRRGLLRLAHAFGVNLPDAATA